MTPATTWSTAAELVERAVGLVVDPVNIFTGDHPGGITAQLFIRHPKLDRNGAALVIDGLPVFVFEPTGIRGYRTLSGRIVFPALDHPVPPPVTPLMLRFRLEVAAPGLIAHPTGLELDFAPGSGAPMVATVTMYPAPDYLFPSQVTVLHGVVVGHVSDHPLLMRAIPEPSATDPSPVPSPTDQAMTSHGYGGRSSVSGPLSFSLGLRSGRRPKAIKVFDAATGALLASIDPPMNPGDLLTIQL